MNERNVSIDRDGAIKRANGFVAEIDPQELAVRLIERGCHMKRPHGLFGKDAWQQFERAASEGAIPGYIVRDFEAMADIAVEYFSECINSLQRKS